MVRPVVPTGIEALDEALHGGLPVGAITELIGPECSGRTSVALAFVAGLTQAGKVCAWLDVSNAFDPASAAAAGVDLRRLLWVRCGALKTVAVHGGQRFALPEQYLIPKPAIKGLHGGGCGGHPRGEVKGMAQAVSGLLQPNIAPRCAEPQRRERPSSQLSHGHPEQSNIDCHPERSLPRFVRQTKSKDLHMFFNKLQARHTGVWAQLDQALRAADLLLQGGGFSAIVLDLGSLAPEFASRVPLATWFRYRAAAESTQASLLLLAQYGCAKSSAELTLRLEPGDALRDEATVFTGMAHSVEVARRRFTGAQDNVVPLRKPVQRANVASWQSHAAWAGVR
jgi:recombination protein RecA